MDSRVSVAENGLSYTASTSASVVSVKHPPVLQCGFCDKLFLSRKAGLQHERNCHLNPFRPSSQICDKCGLSIARKGNFQKHLQTCKGVVKHAASASCKFCNETFTRTDAARRHEKSCWLNPQHETLECIMCDRQFTRLDKLKAHTAKCNGPAPPPAKRQRIAASTQPSPSIPARLTSVGGTSRRQIVVGAGEPNEFGFMKAETAFRDVMKTYVAENTTSLPINICDYLKNMKGKIVGQLERELEDHGALKFNLFLECMYGKPELSDEEAEKRAFKTKNVPLYNITDIENAVTAAIDKICDEEDDFQGKGSGFTLTAIKRLQLRINKLEPICASSYIDLPMKIKNKKAVINPQNNDNACFKWAILSRFVEGWSPERVDKRYNDLEERFNFTEIEFPTPLQHINIFEKNNPGLSINIYALDDNDKVVPIRVAKEEETQHFDLLMLMTEDKNSHYCYIKNFSRLVRSQKTSHTEKIYTCKRCLKCYDEQPRVTGLTGTETLADHRRYCNDYAPVRVAMPQLQKNGKPPVLKFTNYHNADKVPVVVYADFEAMLLPMPTCLPNPVESYTFNYQKHEPYSFCMYIKVDKSMIPATKISSLPTKPKLYRGKNAAQRFREEIVRIGNLVKDIYDQSEPMRPLTFDEQSNYALAVFCCHCSGPFTIKNRKVHDHDHLTGKYIGPSCNNCNKLRRRPKKLPVLFHNLTYDENFIIKQLGYDTQEIFIIPHTEEKLIKISKHLDDNFSIQFIDTFRFMSASLASLAQNLPSSEFKTTSIFYKPDEMELVTRKGVFPYDYVDSWGKLDETQLPPKEAFYNRLTDTVIDEEEYQHAQKVWDKFGCHTLGHYSDVYLKTDVMILCDVFENFRDLCLSTYGLDCVRYISAPGFSFDAMMKKTKVELELLSDYDMHMFIEAGIRGGVTQCVKRHCVANNKNVPATYDSKKPPACLQYVDANNLYGWAMSLPLPYSDFKWIDTDLDVTTIPNDGEFGYILEVDIDYPVCLHSEHKDLPFLPVNECPPESKQTKLMTTLTDKKKYVVHYENLKQAIDNGLELKKIHRVLEFRQKAWLKPYIDMNTEKRKLARNEFEKDFYKLMNNATYGKLMENKRKRQRMELVCLERRAKKLIAKPSFKCRTIYNENLALIKMEQENILLDKPIYAGFTVLDLSKTLMYHFHYNIMKSRYANKLHLAYMDTDSFVYEIGTHDFYADLASDPAFMSEFDTSAYSPTHPCFSTLNKKVIGKFKDECGGNDMVEFVGLRAKMYSYTCQGKEVKRAKGIQKCVVKNKVLFIDYKNVLLNRQVIKVNVNSIRSHQHDVYSQCMNKTALTWMDDKRQICDDGIHTLPYG